MNLTGQAVYQKGSVRKREKPNDRAFLAWIRKQPSATGAIGKVEACHYRTAANSGVGCKPLFSAIPLTKAEHRLQHQIGQYAFRPREWWEAKVKYYYEKWLQETQSSSKA